MIKTGFAFHVHHDKLVEFCTDYDERVSYIKSNKPLNEQELRLRLFKLTPQELLPKSEAWEAYGKAKKAHNEAREACSEAWEAYDKAWEAYGKAKKACESELIKLHAELCPNCPWDGKTIFPKKASK